VNFLPLVTHHFPLVMHHFPLVAHHFPLVTHHFPLVTRHFPLVTRHFPLVTRHFPLVTHHFPLVTHHFPLVTHHFPLVTRHFPLVTHHFPLVTRHLPLVMGPFLREMAEMGRFSVEMPLFALPARLRNPHREPLMAKPLHFDAINPFTGKPFTFDDPNLRFINGIGMYLEPSDPDFTPYAVVNPPPKAPQKTKKMKHNTFYPSRIGDQILWLENFRNKIMGYLAALAISAPDAAAIIAECRWLIYLLGSWLPAQRAWGQSCTDAVAAAQTGANPGPFVLPVFVPPSLPGPDGTNPAVVAQPEGALTRIFDFIQKLKDSGLVTEAIATDLRIVGTVKTSTPGGALKPVITAKVNGLHVDLRWSWDGHADEVDLLQIQVNRNDGKGWVDLVFDTTPNYTDTTPFPPAASIWQYRGIFHANGAPVGTWSDITSVVAGS
jgi:hypothetical protein